MNINKRGPLLLALLFGTVLTSLAAYNLADTYLLDHEASAYVDDSSSSNTSVSSTTGSSSGSATSTTTSETASSASSGVSPYSKTAVSLTSKTIKNSRSVSTKYFILDIQLASVEDFKTHMVLSSSGNPGTGNSYKATVASQVSSIQSSGETVLAAINGDSAYFNASRGGFVIRNSITYRSTAQVTTANTAGCTSGQCMATYADGTANTFTQSTTTISALKSKACTNCFCFGPTLLENGKVAVTTSQDVDQCSASGSNERSALGYVSAFHFVYFLSQGRLTTNDGFTLYEVANLLKDYGCNCAYNLDGGGASYLWYNGARQDTSDSNRAVGDILYVKAS